MSSNDSGKGDYSRREFFWRVGAGVPALSLAAHIASAATESVMDAEAVSASSKFTPIDLSQFFNASSEDLGPRDRARVFIGGEAAKDGLVRALSGKRLLQGAPFWLGPEGTSSKAWIALSTESSGWTAPSIEINLGKRAHYICIASFCDWDKNETPPPGSLAFESLGEEMAHVTLNYDDGSRQVLPIRRRFETNSPREGWGHSSAAALPPMKEAASSITDPLSSGLEWGSLQECLGGGGSGGSGLGDLWICALENPHPERTIRSLSFKAASSDPWLFAGVTLYHRPEFPFRYERLALYRITLPEANAELRDRWRATVDLGTIVRTYPLPDFNAGDWLASPSAGLGEAAKTVSGAQYLYAEVTASRAATLTLHDAQTGQRYEFELGRATLGQELAGEPAGSRIELLERSKQWIHGRVIDPSTRQPTPVRLAFRSKEGRYIPPYGHRTDINDGFFQDYGGDIKLMDTPFAYVDGTFQVELPVGEVYLEMTKGFEHQAVRRKIEIAAGQRELTVEIPRFANMRSQGWVTADTHTHFLSPTTAVLEAQAEGLNLINLLSAQWGQLFTNVGDIPHGPLVSKDHEAMVWVGSENRQHVLGHLALLGVHGAPVFPLSADGPGEAFLGDPLWKSLAEWSDTCRERQGLTVCAHFPFPTGEIAADIVLGKIDAVEIWPRNEIEVHRTPTERFTTLRYRDWYHYLNCGYRVPGVGGTDKMGAYMPAGTNRCYAYIGQDEFTFANWAKAVRSGNTFVTSGPLLLFHADGNTPGEEITLGAGGGTVEVRAEVHSFVPFHRVEVIFNGQVVASREEPAGTRSMTLVDKVNVPGPGWLAARCSSNLGPTTVWRYKIAAHTSAVYIKVPGQELFSAPAASYFLKLIEFAETYVDTLAIRPNPDEYAKIRAIYAQARAELHRRMHQHGVPH